MTPPAAITIAATEPAGARGNVLTSDASRVLYNFLTGGSAVDDTDPAPARQTPQASIGGVLVDATENTLFPAGVDTTVTFSFKDAAGNTGAATSTVSVRPPVGGQVHVGGEPVQVTTEDGQPLPITITFANLLQPGLVTATVCPGATDPSGVHCAYVGVQHSDDGSVQLAVTVCLQGPFTPTDRLFHFQDSVWLDVTTSATVSEVCGQVGSLSPFVALRVTIRPPTATASAPATVEGTSPAGAAVTLTGSGSDPDSGDPLSFKWMEGQPRWVPRQRSWPRFRSVATTSR